MSIAGLGAHPSQYYGPTFATTDTDSDGTLSLDEFSAIGQNVPGGNNGLDSASIQNLFSAIDSDGDGTISKSEAKTAFDKLTDALKGVLLQAQESAGGSSPQGLFASADSDGSGGLSFDEFKSSVTQNLPSGATAPTDDQLQAAFDKIDKNGDGQISQDEMKAAHHGHHHRMGPPPSDQASNTDSDSSTDPLASSDSTSQTNGASPDLNSLLLQAVSAYNTNPSQDTTSNLVDQLINVLKAA